MKLIDTTQTKFQRIEVWGNAREVEFRVAGAIHASWHRDRFLTGLAWDGMSAAVMLRPSGPPASLLMLGLGGGTSLRQISQLAPGVKITALEIDRGMVDLARRYMDLDSLGVEIHCGDAYTWLGKNKRKFDAVVDDVYGSGALDVSRPCSYSPDMLVWLKRALDFDSVFVANLITGPGHRKMQGLFRTFFKETFAGVKSVTAPLSMNEALAGGRSLLSPVSLREFGSIWKKKADQDLWAQLKTRSLV